MALRAILLHPVLEKFSTQVQELAGGNFELSFILNSLEEIVPWILSWGKDCEVVSPGKLQRKANQVLAAAENTSSAFS